LSEKQAVLNNEADHLAITPSDENGVWKPGFGLPGKYYFDDHQFQEDLDRIFYSNWLYAAHGSQIPNPGDYITIAIGRDSIILVRDKSGSVKAHFNTCRHRGSLICLETSGHVTKLVCSYHQWVYGLDGKLDSCRLMNDDIQKDDLSLHSAHVEEVCGFIFLCLAKSPPSFAAAREVFSLFLAPHALHEVKSCHEHEYLIKANWKTVIENNRECYHCASGHREFCLSNFDYGMPGDPRSSAEFKEEYDRMQRKWRDLGLEPGPVNFPDGQWFRFMRFPLKPGFLTESLDGHPVGPILGRFPDHDLGSLRIVGLPNMWFHVNSDYLMTTRLIPVSATETKATIAWFVHKDAREGIDYDVKRVSDVWRITGEQDWQLCEANQCGMQSSRFVPGPLSAIAEQGVSHFAEWYFGQLVQHDPDNQPRESSVVISKRSRIDNPHWIEKATSKEVANADRS